jgi:hypothetical protein
LAKYRYGADQLIILEHRYGKQPARARNLHHRDRRLIAFDVGFFLCQVGNMHDLFASRQAPKRVFRTPADDRITTAKFFPRWRCVMHRRDAEHISIVSAVLWRCALTDLSRRRIAPPRLKTRHRCGSGEPR